jgi:DNA processing protein
MSLSLLRGLTPRKLHALAWERGSAAACAGAVRARRAGSSADQAHLDRADPGAVAEQLAAYGGRLIGPHDPEYPQELRDLLHDPPAWLFARGLPLRSDVERVAVVGARKCSPLGREVARDIGMRLGSAGVEVVSGAAYGIDAAAHEGALAGAGRTIAVLGAGVDVRYPRSSGELLERITERGSLVSEYPPGRAAEPHHFPARNRIVAALCRAVVVVEGASRSGSRISVDHALDLGREVFAVPGPITSPLTETPHEIIREGATLIRGAEDLLQDLGLMVTAGAPDVPPVPDLPAEEARAWGALSGPALPDTVAKALGVSVPEAVSALISLELRGLVRTVGGRYERTLRSRPSGEA